MDLQILDNAVVHRLGLAFMEFGGRKNSVIVFRTLIIGWAEQLSTIMATLLFCLFPDYDKRQLFSTRHVCTHHHRNTLFYVLVAVTIYPLKFESFAEEKAKNQPSFIRIKDAAGTIFCKDDLKA